MLNLNSSPFPRSFRDRDFILTHEGFIFCVVGYLHPVNRAIGFLKYQTHSNGAWGAQQKYQRTLPYYHVTFVGQSLSTFLADYPDFHFFSPVHNQTLPAVPYSNIKKAFFPETWSSKIREAPKKSVLESKALRFIQVLAQHSHVPEDSFGVTGSLLLGIANPQFSDLNITCHQPDQLPALQKTITELIHSNREGFGPINPEKNRAWINSHATNFPLSSTEFEELRQRKWNNGTFEETFFSFTPIRSTKQITERERYGQQYYRVIGPVRIYAKIKNDLESSYNPGIYQISTETILTQPHGINIDPATLTSIVTYEGVYANYARTGEEIEAFGILEEVQDAHHCFLHYRLVLGTTQLGKTEYLRLR